MSKIYDVSGTPYSIVLLYTIESAFCRQLEVWALLGGKVSLQFTAARFGAGVDELRLLFLAALRDGCEEGKKILPDVCNSTLIPREINV